MNLVNPMYAANRFLPFTSQHTIGAALLDVLTMVRKSGALDTLKPRVGFYMVRWFNQWFVLSPRLARAAGLS